MSTEGHDAILSTFVIEERLGSDGSWYSTEEAAELAARLSIRLYVEILSQDLELFPEWIASGHRKHLRRAKTSQFEKVIREVPGVVIDGPHGRMFASALHRKGETPALISKLQLSHFKESIKDHSVSSRTLVEVVLNDKLGMSFGKAVIAAAHVAQSIFFSLRESEETERLQRWAEDDYHVSVRWGDAANIVSDARIVDHGLTEVPTGSVTAIARWSA